MGTHADDLIDGRTCSHCGVMFAEPHGFPILCKSCHSEADAEDKKTYPVARVDEL